MKEYDIGIIGAMDSEVNTLISHLGNHTSERFGSITFHGGELYGRRVVIARCGIGKVFAALCCEAMIVRYSPRLVINTGVGGAISPSLRPLDVVIADRLCQHDMDTSPLGDPKGMISGIDTIYFETDRRAREILLSAAIDMRIRVSLGTIASGDRFIATSADKAQLASDFGADVCEMEGGAIAQVCYVNETDFAVVRAISDSADGSAEMDYAQFLPQAAKTSAELTLALIKAYPVED